jgi:TonB family protein
MLRTLTVLSAVAVFGAAYGAPVSGTVPKPKDGRPLICTASYPKDALLQRREGISELLFNVTEQGAVSGVIVAASSGTLDLDLTAAACATKWKYLPATRNGEPVVGAVEAHVTWSLGSGEPPGTTPKIKLPAENCILTYDGPPNRAKKPGPTIVRYQLAKGAVTATAIERSSGSAAMDTHAARCVATWHFEPVLPNGSPATGHYAAVFDWQQKPPPEF